MADGERFTEEEVGLILSRAAAAQAGRSWCGPHVDATAPAASCRSWSRHVGRIYAAVYVLAKGRPVRWFHHVTVATAVHCVDALTGPDGHEQASYIDSYFEHGHEHVVRRVEPDEWEVL